MKSAALAASAWVAACGGAPGMGDDAADDPSEEQQAATVDGLADAFATFKEGFLGLGFDQQFRMGYAFHPGLSTEKLTVDGHPLQGIAGFDFANKRINASISNVPEGTSFDLWFVKNVAGSGRTVKPESGDQFFKVGTFGPPTETTQCFDFNCQQIDVVIGSNINFDLDLIVVTRAGQHPSSSRIAVGSRTLLEKRFFRARAGKTLDPVTGTLANNVETGDPLVRRGAHLFFNETFGGNGRTCGTCHRAEDNLTIDAAFIATLPKADPLFVNETNLALAKLEDSKLLRTRGLIRENPDGFEDPTRKFVARSTNHTFSLGLTNGIANSIGFFPSTPPDHRLGWGGDGAPGRGTLNEFSFGAVVQHFTKNLARRPGVDFRTPTQEELDALEAFQLFTGRQKRVNVGNIVFREARATRGRDLVLGAGQCGLCHKDFDVNPDTFNQSFNTGVAELTPDLPLDNGFLTSNFFNPPPLVEAADTGPFFHNNAVADIESVIAFYVSDAFRNSFSGFTIDLTAAQQTDVASFLRIINAAENVRQVRKRVQFVKANRSSGNTDLLNVAIADTQDAIDVLGAKGLNAAAVNELFDIRQTLQIAKANPDANRPAFMDHALVYLNLVRGELFTSNPDNQF